MENYNGNNMKLHELGKYKEQHFFFECKENVFDCADSLCDYFNDQYSKTYNVKLELRNMNNFLEHKEGMTTDNDKLPLRFYMDAYKHRRVRLDQNIGQNEFNIRLLDFLYSELNRKIKVIHKKSGGTKLTYDGFSMENDTYEDFDHINVLQAEGADIHPKSFIVSLTSFAKNKHWDDYSPIEVGTENRVASLFDIEIASKYRVEITTQKNKKRISLLAFMLSEYNTQFQWKQKGFLEDNEFLVDSDKIVANNNNSSSKIIENELADLNRRFESFQNNVSINNGISESPLSKISDPSHSTRTNSNYMNNFQAINDAIQPIVQALPHLQNYVNTIINQGQTPNNNNNAIINQGQTPNNNNNAIINQGQTPNNNNTIVNPHQTSNNNNTIVNPHQTSNNNNTIVNPHQTSNNNNETNHNKDNFLGMELSIENKKKNDNSLDDDTSVFTTFSTKSTKTITMKPTSSEILNKESFLHQDFQYPHKIDENKFKGVEVDGVCFIQLEKNGQLKALVRFHIEKIFGVRSITKNMRELLNMSREYIVNGKPSFMSKEAYFNDNCMTKHFEHIPSWQEKVKKFLDVLFNLRRLLLNKIPVPIKITKENIEQMKQLVVKNKMEIEKFYKYRWEEFGGSTTYAAEFFEKHLAVPCNKRKNDNDLDEGVQKKKNKTENNKLGSNCIYCSYNALHQKNQKKYIKYKSFFPNKNKSCSNGATCEKCKGFICSDCILGFYSIMLTEKDKFTDESMQYFRHFKSVAIVLESYENKDKKLDRCLNMLCSCCMMQEHIEEAGQCLREEAGAGQCLREEAGAGQCLREEAGAGQCLREEAGAGQCLREEAGTGQCLREEAGENKKEYINVGDLIIPEYGIALNTLIYPVVDVYSFAKQKLHYEGIWHYVISEENANDMVVHNVKANTSNYPLSWKQMTLKISYKFPFSNSTMIWKKVQILFVPKVYFFGKENKGKNEMTLEDASNIYRFHDTNTQFLGGCDALLIIGYNKEHPENGTVLLYRTKSPLKDVSSNDEMNQIFSTVYEKLQSKKHDAIRRGGSNGLPVYDDTLRRNLLDCENIAPRKLSGCMWLPRKDCLFSLYYRSPKKDNNFNATSFEYAYPNIGGRFQMKNNESKEREANVSFSNVMVSSQIECVMILNSLNNYLAKKHGNAEIPTKICSGIVNDDLKIIQQACQNLNKRGIYLKDANDRNGLKKYVFLLTKEYIELTNLRGTLVTHSVGAHLDNDSGFETKIVGKTNDIKKCGKGRGGLTKDEDEYGEYVAYAIASH